MPNRQESPCFFILSINNTSSNIIIRSDNYLRIREIYLYLLIYGFNENTTVIAHDPLFPFFLSNRNTFII